MLNRYFHPDPPSASSHRDPRREAEASAREAAQATRELAKQAGSEVAGKARATAEEGKGAAAHRMGAVARAARAAADALREENQEWLGSGIESAAEQLERAAGRVRDNDVNALVRDLEGFARRRPAVFVGAMAVAGLALGRFLRSSREHEHHDEQHDAVTGGEYRASGDVLDPTTPRSPHEPTPRRPQDPFPGSQPERSGL
jgi:hypothetical protein